MKHKSLQTRSLPPAAGAGSIEPAQDATPMARRLVAARLITLMKLLHLSATRVYRAETRLSDFEWRVLTQVGSHEPISLTALAALLHQDKGQVSHAVGGLVKSGYVSRGHLRAPIALSKTGRNAYARILQIGRARNRILLRELTITERTNLPLLLVKLQANARLLLMRETAARAGSPASGDESREDAALATVPLQSRRARPVTRARLLAQDLFILHNLIQRSAAATFRRETGLSDFEWRVLSQLAEHAPLTLIEFVPLLSRDKSQVGRTLTRLAERGLIIRETIGTGRHIRLDVSAQGREVYSQLAKIALERNDLLIAGLRAEEQRALMTIFDKLTRGANALLARTQAP